MLIISYGANMEPMLIIIWRKYGHQMLRYYYSNIDSNICNNGNCSQVIVDL